MVRSSRRVCYLRLPSATRCAISSAIVRLPRHRRCAWPGLRAFSVKRATPRASSAPRPRFAPILRCVAVQTCQQHSGLRASQCLQSLHCGVTLRCTRRATAGFARLRTRVNSNVSRLSCGRVRIHRSCAVGRALRCAFARAVRSFGKLGVPLTSRFSIRSCHPSSSAPLCVERLARQWLPRTVSPSPSQSQSLSWRASTLHRNHQLHSSNSQSVWCASSRVPAVRRSIRGHRSAPYCCARWQAGAQWRGNRVG